MFSTKKSLKILLLLTIPLFLGWIAGVCTSRHFISKAYDSSIIAHAREDASSILIVVQVLKQLRNGDLEKAVEGLEVELDDKIMRNPINPKRSEKDNWHMIQAMKYAKDYRSKYKRVTKYPEIDKTVNSVLSEVEER